MDNKIIGKCNNSEKNLTIIDNTQEDKYHILSAYKKSNIFWNYVIPNEDIYVMKESNRTYNIGSFHHMHMLPRKALVEKLEKRKKYFKRGRDKLLHDSLRGLVWLDNEVKAIDNMTYKDAASFCDEYEYKIYKNWHLPTLSELSTLVTYDPNRKNKSITLRGKMKPLKYWTKDRTKLTLFEKITFEDFSVLYMDFDSGEVDYVSTGEYASYKKMEVTCVHDDKAKLKNWLSKEKGVVKDSLNNILWQDSYQVKNKSMTVDEATKYCTALKIGEVTKWRLPIISELLSIFDNDVEGLAIDKIFTSRDMNDSYMSGTKVGYDANWMLSPSGSMDLYSLNSNRSGYVRCVKDLNKDK